MRTRPNFGIVGQSRPATNSTPGTVMTMIDYVNNIVESIANPTAYTIDSVNATGGTITYSGNYKIHTYTGSGTFVPTFTGNIELLLIGGGGGGDYVLLSTASASGGGGAGGLLYYGNEQSNKDANGTAISVVAGVTYTITIGAGGTKGDFVGTYSGAPNASATAGQNSTFVGGVHNIIAYGGGPSGGVAGSNNGGSGGAVAGSPVTGQGNYGGAAVGSSSSPTITAAGGGGGGAGSNGYSGRGHSPDNYSINGVTIYFVGGNGGDGVPYSISGSRTWYAGGGAGGGGGGSRAGYGGAGGGGGRQYGAAGAGSDGLANTGGGGAGTAGFSGGSGKDGFAGGSGICIIRYLNI